MKFDYRILYSNKKKHELVDKIVSFQYYMDIIINAIKYNDLDTLNKKRLLAIFDMIQEFDFLLDIDYDD